MIEDDPTLMEGYREKLVRRKQEWAAQGRLLTGEGAAPNTRRLPPGQREVKDWPVLDLGGEPDINLDTWRLIVDGAVENQITWDWPTFLAQPQVTLGSDIHCVTGWSRFDNAWMGVHVAHLLEVARPKPDAMHCVFHSYDGYTTNVRLDRFADEDVLLAHTWNGKALPREHGGPLRVVIPKWYFWKSAKWVKRIEFLAADRPGFWEVRGYHNDADPWQEERYS